MAEKQNTPEIRFEGFTDPWEQRKLGDVATRHDNLRIPITAKDRIPGDTPYYGANGIQDYVEGYTHEGEFVLVAEDGATDLDNYPVQLISGLSWVNNHAHVIKAIPDVAQNRFIMHLIKSMDIASYLVGGTRSKLNAEVLMGIELKLPSNSEQIYIGALFSALDSLITLHQRKYDKLCTVKKSMLDKMFPKPGETEPEIRFEGFADPWEQRKFSDMYVVNNERNANCELGYDRTLSIATMTFNGGNGAADDSLSNYKVIRIGDIAFEGHTNKVHAYGRFVLNDAGDGLMSPRFSCLRPIVEQRYSFWKYYIPREESMRPILVNATKSGTMMNELVPDDLMRESILVPCLAEQEVIGNSLSQLDHLITLHQRMCSIFCFCAHGSRINFASILQGQLRILRYLRPMPKMRASPSALASGTTDIVVALSFSVLSPLARRPARQGRTPSLA